MSATEIDAYIAGFPSDVQQRLEQIKALILEIAPDAAQSISYAMPAFKLNGRVLVYFAAFKNHIGLYPAPIALAQFNADLEPYKSSKGAVQFLHTQALPLEVIARIVRFRVQIAILPKPSSARAKR